MKLVYDWLIVDESIEDGAVFFNKVILLNKKLIESEYKKHVNKTTNKNLTVTECFLFGVEPKSEHYQQELEEMNLNGKFYKVLGDYLPKGDIG